MVPRIRAEGGEGKTTEDRKDKEEDMARHKVTVVLICKELTWEMQENKRPVGTLTSHRLVVRSASRRRNRITRVNWHRLHSPPAILEVPRWSTCLCGLIPSAGRSRIGKTLSTADSANETAPEA